MAKKPAKKPETATANPEVPAAPGKKQCPVCAEYVPSDSTTCPKCHRHEFEMKTRTVADEQEREAELVKAIYMGRPTAEQEQAAQRLLDVFDGDLAGAVTMLVKMLEQESDG